MKIFCPYFTRPDSPFFQKMRFSLKNENLFFLGLHPSPYLLTAGIESTVVVVDEQMTGFDVFAVGRLVLDDFIARRSVSRCRKQAGEGFDHIVLFVMSNKLITVGCVGVQTFDGEVEACRLCCLLVAVTARGESDTEELTVRVEHDLANDIAGQVTDH